MGLFGDFWVNELSVPQLPTSVDVTDWDKLWLGDLPTAWPGLCQVEASVALNTDVVHYTEPQTYHLPPINQSQKVYIVDKGYEPAKVRATLIVWTLIQWNQLKVYLSNITPKTTNKLRPSYFISHPATDLLGINQVIVDSVVVRPPEEQTLYVDVFMTQWFPYLVTKVVRQGAGPVAAAAPNAGANLTP